MGGDEVVDEQHDFPRFQRLAFRFEVQRLHTFQHCPELGSVQGFRREIEREKALVICDGLQRRGLTRSGLDCQPDIDAGDIGLAGYADKSTMKNAG